MNLGKKLRRKKVSPYFFIPYHAVAIHTVDDTKQLSKLHSQEEESTYASSIPSQTRNQLDILRHRFRIVAQPFGFSSFSSCDVEAVSLFKCGLARKTRLLSTLVIFLSRIVHTSPTVLWAKMRDWPGVQIKAVT